MPSGCCSPLGAGFPYSNLRHRSYCSWWSKVELFFAWRWSSIPIALWSSIWFSWFKNQGIVLHYICGLVVDMIFKVLHPTALDGWEPIELVQLPPPWSYWQPVLACSWNTAAESAWLQRNQWHLQPGGHPVRDGKRHRTFQWNASHIDAFGKAERGCS